MGSEGWGLSWACVTNDQNIKKATLSAIDSLQCTITYSKISQEINWVVWLGTTVWLGNIFAYDYYLFASIASNLRDSSSCNQPKIKSRLITYMCFIPIHMSISFRMGIIRRGDGLSNFFLGGWRLGGRLWHLDTSQGNKHCTVGRNA